MGEIDGSSGVAQDAPPRIEVSGTEDNVSRPETREASWLKRLFRGRESGGGKTGADSQNRDVVQGPEAPLPGMVNLRKLRVEDVAIPRAEIVSASVDSTRDQLLEVFRETGLTRLPIFDGTLDTPVGMAHLKDFALRYGFATGGDFDLRGMLRPLVFVPPSMPLGVLLAKMQTERKHMALVIDEYGGVDGLATIEDLIEQVVGEIEDEHDTDEGETFSRDRAGSYIALARTSLEEFESELGLTLTDHDSIDEEEIDTLGGLVFMLAGHVPTRGEVVRHPSGIEFEVIDADPRRIKRLRVRPPGSAPRAAASGDAQPAT